MSSPTYFNADEYLEILFSNKGPGKVEQMKLLADKGNVQACSKYADYLMEGVWDEDRMESDLACGRLAPVPFDPREDPYLIVKRDQYAAIEYYLKAANFENSQCKEVLQAGGMLAFIRKRVDIGFSISRYSDYNICVSCENYVEKASFADKQLSPLIPFPFTRPKIEDPKTAFFANLSETINEKSDICNFIPYLGFIAHVIGCFIMENTIMIENIKSWDTTCSFILLAFVFVVFSIPFGIFTYLNYYYGKKQRMPLCSCDHIKRAYEIRLEKLPEDCRKIDPFLETPWFIRNLHHIKLAFFFSYLIPAIIGLICISQDYEVIHVLYNYFDKVFVWVAVGLLYIFPFVLLLRYKTLTFEDRDCIDQVKYAEDGVKFKTILFDE